MTLIRVAMRETVQDGLEMRPRETVLISHNVVAG